MHGQKLADAKRDLEQSVGRGMRIFVEHQQPAPIGREAVALRDGFREYALAIIHQLQQLIQFPLQGRTGRNRRRTGRLEVNGVPARLLYEFGERDDRKMKRAPRRVRYMRN